MEQTLYFTNHVAQTIDQIVDTIQPAKVIVIVDVNTGSLVLPRLQAMSKAVESAPVIMVKAGDINKTIDSLTYIWRQLGELGASRHSMIINLGGGVVTDMGAFAAATFKRGVTFINVPTTLLAAVDAAVGGKTGINFNGLKNEIGVFCEADSVIISTTFFNTLPEQELLSGYAEMIKHGLLDGPEVYNRLLGYRIAEADSDRLLKLLEESVKVKADIVRRDPTECNLRRALNLGHTAGHAFESLALKRKSPIPHGYAVAWGLVVDLVLSHLKFGFPSDELHRLASYVRDNYGAFDLSCDDYSTLLDFMRHDKKNVSTDAINFTLLRAIGDPVIDQIVSDDDIKAALDIYRDLMGI